MADNYRKISEFPIIEKATENDLLYLSHVMAGGYKSRAIKLKDILKIYEFIDDNGNISLGNGSLVDGSNGIAIGTDAEAYGDNTIQLGPGTNEDSDTFKVYSFTLLDLVTGKIPADRLPKASKSSFGIVKIGEGLQVQDGVISCSGGGGGGVPVSNTDKILFTKNGCLCSEESIEFDPESGTLRLLGHDRILVDTATGLFGKAGGEITGETTIDKSLTAKSKIIQDTDNPTDSGLVVTNSITLKEVESQNNKILSTNGQKGYYWNRIDSSNFDFETGLGTIIIYLCNEQISNSEGTTNNDLPASSFFNPRFSCEFAAGDRLSIDNDSYLLNFGTITEVLGNRVTLTSTEENKFTKYDGAELSVLRGFRSSSGQGLRYHSAFVQAKPNTGSALINPIGISLGISSVTTGLAATTFGKNTEAHGPYSMASGLGTKSYSTGGAAFGRYNENDPSGSKIFQVGVGTADNNRKDALFVSTSGVTNIDKLHVSNGNNFSIGDKSISDFIVDTIGASSIDDALSPTSKNPVQNKVITNSLTQVIRTVDGLNQLLTTKFEEVNTALEGKQDTLSTTTPANLGLYKLETNNLGQVTRVVEVEKADIIALGFTDPTAPLAGVTKLELDSSSFDDVVDKINEIIITLSNEGSLENVDTLDPEQSEDYSVDVLVSKINEIIDALK